MALSSRIPTFIIAVYPPVLRPSFPYGEVALYVWFIYRENKNAYSASLLLFAAFQAPVRAQKFSFHSAAYSSVEGMIRYVCKARLIQSRSMEYFMLDLSKFSLNTAVSTTPVPSIEVIPPPLSYLPFPSAQQNSVVVKNESWSFPKDFLVGRSVCGISS